MTARCPRSVPRAASGLVGPWRGRGVPPVGRFWAAPGGSVLWLTHSRRVQTSDATPAFEILSSVPSGSPRRIWLCSQRVPTSWLGWSAPPIRRVAGGIA